MMGSDSTSKPNKQVATISLMELHRRLPAYERREFTWRIGGEAAKHRIAAEDLRIRGMFVLTISVVLMYFGFKLRVPPVWAVGLSVYVFAGYCICRACVETARGRRATGRALGVKINRKLPPPPNTKAHYLAWCKKYGLQPYPFRPPDSTTDVSDTPAPSP